MNRRSFFPLASLLLAGALMASSCSKEKAPVENKFSARTLFVSGKVEWKLGSADWQKLSVGQSLDQGAVIRTDRNGRCDIQVGGESVFRMQSDSEIRLSELSQNLESGKKSTQLELTIGKVLVKPKELKPGESFQVRTPTAVAGVRGTRFSVETSPEKDTRISVLAGKVTLSKRIPAMETADKEVIQSSKVLQKIDQRLKEETVEVTPNQSVEVKAKDVEKVNKDVGQVVELVKDIREKVSTADSKKSSEQIQKEVDQALGAKVSVAKIEQSAANISQIQKTETLPEKDKKELQTFSQAVEQVKSAEAMSTLVINLQNATDADIFVNDILIGIGSLEQMVESGKTHKIKIEREGFMTKQFEVNLTSGERKLFSMTLDAIQPKELPRLVWEKNVSTNLQGTPWTTASGKVFVSSANGQLISLDRRGRELWTFSLGSVLQSSPVEYNGVVYIGNSKGVLFAVNAENGRLIWKQGAGSIVYGNRVAIKDQQLVLGTAKGDLVSLNLQSGKVTWVFHAQSGIFTTPRIVNNLVYFGSEDNQVYAIDRNSGTKVWSYKTGRRIVQSSPAFGDGKIFIGSFDNFVYAFDALKGDLVWRFKTSDMVLASPVFANGMVYVASANGTIYGVGARSGKAAWAVSANGRVNGDVAFHNGLIYVNVGNEVKAFHGGNGLLAWSFPLNGKAGSGVAFYGNEIFTLTGNGKLYSLRAQ